MLKPAYIEPLNTKYSKAVMETLQLDKTNMQQTASLIEQHQDACSSLIGHFDGEVYKQKVTENYDKYIIRNEQASIRSIVIDCVDGRITAVTFYGSINISYADLLEIYGYYNEQFVPYDDAHHISFKRKGNSTVKIVLFETDKRNHNWQQQSLKNLSIHIYKNVP
jgi:hypothetical protein